MFIIFTFRSVDRMECGFYPLLANLNSYFLKKFSNNFFT